MQELGCTELQVIPQRPPFDRVQLEAEPVIRIKLLDLGHLGIHVGSPLVSLAGYTFSLSQFPSLLDDKYPAKCLRKSDAGWCGPAADVDEDNIRQAHQSGSQVARRSSFTPT